MEGRMLKNPLVTETQKSAKMISVGFMACSPVLCSRRSAPERNHANKDSVAPTMENVMSKKALRNAHFVESVAKNPLFLKGSMQCGNLDLMLEVVKRNHECLKYVSEELRQNPDMIAAAKNH
eukprot:scaffold1445_cov235-Pinguiococcus_pyrenoidosus.AAC.1